MKKLIAPLASVALVLAACGGSSGKSENPKATLETALDNMATMEGAAVGLSLESDVASLQALSSEGATPLSEDAAQKILDSSIAMKSKGQGVEGEFEVVINVAGEDDVQLKYVDKTMYAQANVEHLLETFGEDPAQAQALAQQAQTQGVTFVKPLVDGEWIGITGADQFMQQSGAQSPADQQEAFRRLADAIAGDATVTSEGGEDPGEHLVATIELRAAYDALMKQAEKLGGLGGGAGLPPASEVPEGDIELDVWVDDERVTQFEFDLTQLKEFEEAQFPEGVEQAAIRMTIDEFDDEVEAPGDFTEVSAQELSKVFGQMFMGTPQP